jgi:hypothetical protein
MDTVVVPCHACGSNNPVAEFHCDNSLCGAVIRLRLVETTQHLPAITTEADSDQAAALRLVREAYLVGGLLLQSAYRLNALLQTLARKEKV